MMEGKMAKNFGRGGRGAVDPGVDSGVDPGGGADACTGGEVDAAGAVTGTWV
jgi:hypothetical protein